MEAVAIVGLGGLFAGAPTIEAFWDLIREGRDASSEVDPDRWALPADEVYQPWPPAPDRVYCRRGYFVRDFHLEPTGLAVDPEFLARLDPSVRFLLHAGRQAWESGVTTGLDRSRVGVIVGQIALPTEAATALALEPLERIWRAKLARPDRLTKMEVGPHWAGINRYVTGLPAGMLARALGLGGGTYALDAACASSLYALKLAADTLLDGRADAMLAGGLSRPDSLYTQMGFCQLQALSRQGRGLPFDARADGLLVGEGAGLVLLKRLTDARAAGDRIWGVLRGVGLSNDVQGNLLAPSGEGQLRAMEAAYAQAGWSPDDVDLIEGHATGTPVGDRVELESLGRLWTKSGRTDRRCVIGSVKANVGHLLTGAGAASLIKILLALDRGLLPPTANFQIPCGPLATGTVPFKVLQEAREWERRRPDVPRRVAVSGFGFGGTNAHVLIEEWLEPGPESRRVTPIAVRSPESRPAVAIVGLAASFGPWPDLAAVAKRVLGGDDRKPGMDRGWFGAEKIYRPGRGPDEKPGWPGYYCREVRVSVGRFRIPPKEVAEMLPQQAQMLQVAADALADAGYDPETGLKTGVFIGLALDPNTTNYHFRWAMAPAARRWVAERGLDLTPARLEDLIASWRRAAGPPLTADRTLGALASIVASRVAREFRVGGPSHAVMNEEASGLRALEVGLRALRNLEIDRALVGAVDFPGDIRVSWGSDEKGSWDPEGRPRPLTSEARGAIPGEGAAALVLKRLEDARRDGDRIYAVIQGLGLAGGSADPEMVADDPTSIWLWESALERALERAYQEAGVSPDEVGLIEAHASGRPAEDLAEARVLPRFFHQPPRDGRYALTGAKADLGHAGAAAGLASLVKAVLCLHDRTLPPLRPGDGLRPEFPAWFQPPATARYWLRDRAAGPRQAGVNAVSGDGNAAHVVLAEYPRDEPVLVATHLGPPATETGEALFPLAGEDRAGLETALRELCRLMDGATDMTALATRWWREHRPGPNAPRRLALLARTPDQLTTLIGQAGEALAGDFRSLSSMDLRFGPNQDRLFITAEPLTPGGRVAFVFPGSGNHFPGLGQDLAATWPELFRRLDRENEFLAGQFGRRIFWDPPAEPAEPLDHRALIMAQVAVGVGVHDVVTDLGLAPWAVLGYSLGETAALFATRAWKDRDGMYRRVAASTLFTHELAGSCRAAARTWGLRPGEAVDWLTGVVNRPAEEVRAALADQDRVYLQIVNTTTECVIGGHRPAVENLVARLGAAFVPVPGVSTVHCPVVRAVAREYRDLHFFPDTTPNGPRLYGAAQGRPYLPTPDAAADSILAQALETMDFPRLINQAYADGVRLFLEMGPGSSCSRMIGRILEGRPHVALWAYGPGQDCLTGILRLLGRVWAHGGSLDLTSIYGQRSAFTSDLRAKQAGRESVAGPAGATVVIPTGREDLEVPPLPAGAWPDPPSNGPISGPPPGPVFDPATLTAAIQGTARTQEVLGQAHAQYLRLAQTLSQTLADQARFQMTLLEMGAPDGCLTGAFPTQAGPASFQILEPATREVFLDREECLEFARGTIGRVLGPRFAPIDSFPTRVRLPDEPLMLVDRMVAVEGEALSMKAGRLVTEHDVKPGAWYLDNGGMVPGVAIEAGQADLFLSAYLGVDFQTRGLAVYRLLDAEVTFHGELPRPGQTISYDIRLTHFFRHGQTTLFRFEFDGTIAGRPLMTMRQGCAGFFTPAELAAGRGLVKADLEKPAAPGRRPDDWVDLAPQPPESLSATQVAALYAGDLAQAFGPAFAALPLESPLTLPGGRLRLLDRVTRTDPAGGRHGLGLIRTEMDIHPDDWFLTCHFVDDMVMPGTLMYECCLQSARIFLLGLGWVGESDRTSWEPVPGVASRLKCRGQVVAGTRTAAYEIYIKELGYGPEPYALADAVMYADGRAIVDITDMSIRLSGATRAEVESLWAGRRPGPTPAATIFAGDRLLALQVGRPSEAFGEPYRVFDHGRFVARLPASPYAFMDRINPGPETPAFRLAAGSEAVAEYAPPPDAWYFRDNHGRMPLAVLLEVALQPCGFLAAYSGAALTTPLDLHFRNLGGNAIQRAEITSATGPLTTRVRMTKASSSGGLIIMNFDFGVAGSTGPVYEGQTYFGFFSPESLAGQRGLRGAALYAPTPAEATRARSFDFPRGNRFPQGRLVMIDRIEMLIPDGGPAGLGFIRGTKTVDPAEWFFKAHFHQDPVWPGSLGLEAFIQLLAVLVADRWPAEDGEGFRTADPIREHGWIYRGQVIPTNGLVTVEAVVTAVDQANRRIVADGFLSVDGLVIYQINGFTVGG